MVICGALEQEVSLISDTTLSTEPITFTQRLIDRHSSEPDATAIVFVDPDGGERSLTNTELYESSVRMGRLFLSLGVTEQSVVCVALGNTSAAVIAMYGVWWCGACAVPTSHRLPEAELDQVIAAAQESGRPVVVVGDVTSTRVPVIRRADLERASSMSADPLPIIVPVPGRAMPSGGSTGRSKLITDGQPMVAVPEAQDPISVELYGTRPRQRVLVPGPIYHVGPYGTTFGGLFHANMVVLMERFDAELALRLIERHKIQRIWSVPTQLLRMARVPWIGDADLSSLETIYHSGAACPPWLKRRWIELIGAERVFEAFGSSENVGVIGIRGDEWLEHPGSIGRPKFTDIRIRNEEGADCKPGEVGEIYMRYRREPGEPPPPMYRYWGSPPAKMDDDGFVCVGDLVWQDEDGYVFVADRRVDMLVTGGVNVFPAEVEATLSELEGVRDVAVVGVPDDEWGRRVHAIIETDTPTQEFLELMDRHCRSRVGPPKVPKSYEFVEQLPRNDAGKIRRSQLVADRLSGWTDGMIRAPRH